MLPINIAVADGNSLQAIRATDKNGLSYALKLSMIMRITCEFPYSLSIPSSCRIKDRTVTAIHFFQREDGHDSLHPAINTPHKRNPETTR